MQSLNEKEWRHFRIPDVFDLIQRGKRLKNADHIPGLTPYVSSTSNNNGVDDYIEVTPGTRVFRDCISLANSGSVGVAFYEPFKYVASDHVTALKTVGMSKFVYLFLASTIEKQGSNFNFNREINDARIKNLQIMLPINDACNFDYEYMSQYVRQKGDAMLDKYLNYAEGSSAKLGDFVEIPALNEKDWAGFKIGDVFETNTYGKKTYMPTGALVDVNKIGVGTIPRIRVTAQNNGINGFTKASDDNSFRTFENFVSVSFLGSSFYHPYTASLDMKVHCLKLRKRKMNVFLGLFIAVMVAHNTQGTTYGNQLSSEDLVSKQILLPIDDSGEPDYAYMEQYAKNMMLYKYQQYLEYIERNLHQREAI